MASHKMTDVERKQLSLKIGTLLLYGTFGLLMFGPIAFGAVEPWSMFVLEVGAAFLTLLWLAKQWLDSVVDIRWNPLFLPMAGFGLLILLQMVFRISAYPHDTLSGALLYGAYGMLCFLAGQTVVRSAQARQLAIVLALYGSLMAALALLQGIAPNGKLYWVRTPRLGGWIYGSYVNHNHYAGLMELLVPIPLVISLTRLAHEKERIAAGIAAAVMTGTIFLSGSRGGMLAILVECAVLGVLLARQKKGIRIAIGIGAFALVLVELVDVAGWQRADPACLQYLGRSAFRNLRRNAPLHRPRCVSYVPR